ncbi:hypothetical protein PbJCM13498_39410 [Prolixibacter bellariivorans]|uniref:Uncharacterized protein n=1 Tax=Prolixibacter bellariivorans TaxID=314319 RepID=A0A5M4B5G2_9BACT|nr:hypothetical protein PbJCM13498_39410 [Prolixibacter bellariivorans]
MIRPTHKANKAPATVTGLRAFCLTANLGTQLLIKVLRLATCPPLEEVADRPEEDCSMNPDNHLGPEIILPL